MPPIDSLNVWSLISGQNLTSPRVEWPITPFAEDTKRGCQSGLIALVRKCWHGGRDAAYLVDGRYKLRKDKTSWLVWASLSKHRHNVELLRDDKELQLLSREIRCLFVVLKDKGEHHDVSLEVPEKAPEIYDKMRRADKKFYNPDRGDPDSRSTSM